MLDTIVVHVLTRNDVPEVQTDTCFVKIRFFTLVILFSIAATAALVTFF